MNLRYQINLIKKFLVNAYPQLSKLIKINYGLLPEEIKDEDYIMGASDDKINWKILKPDGNWLPEAEKMIDEMQRGRLFDTMSCTAFALNNVEEMIEINKWGKATNHSDRFLAKASGTSKRGNNLTRVLETRRKQGFVEESEWGWNKDTFNWTSYYSPLTQEIKDKALLNKKKYVFGYDGVWVTKATLLEALKYSPLYVGLYAWYRKGMLYYSVAGPNHACVIINRNTFMAYDSYNPHIKHLAEDFKIYYVKRIYLEKANVDYNLSNIKSLLNVGYRYIIRPDADGQFYKITDNSLEYVKDIRVIADEIAKDLKNSPADINTMLKFLTQEKRIKWLSERDYLNLLK